MNNREKEIRRQMDTLSFVMSRCESDEAYRNYQSKYDELVKELNTVERKTDTDPTTN